jgi:hypothetical protein
MSKEEILEEFRLFAFGTDGIGAWLSDHTDQRVLERLARVEREPLAKVQLNQLLAFGHEAPVSDDFFRYYWLSRPARHPYDVAMISGFDPRWLEADAIVSLAHLRWGLYRLYTDGLLYVGNVRTAYRKLRSLLKPELDAYFARRRFDTEAIRARPPPFHLRP